MGEDDARQAGQLDEESGATVDNLTADYVKKIEQRAGLVKSWMNEMRVKALKIAIQCAKLLSSTAAITFTRPSSSW